MTINLRTRVELTCWDLIIPAMSKLRTIQVVHRPMNDTPPTLKKYMTQVLVFAAAGMLLGLCFSAVMIGIQ